MNYTKPEITSLAPASSVIQSVGLPKIAGSQDSQGQTGFVTNPAYEADE
jgi:hypothetical protein